MIIFTMALKNGKATICRALKSIFTQKNFSDFCVIISDDNSTDNWKNVANEFLNDSRCIVLEANFENVAKNRNFILEYAKKNFPKDAFVCRLDCDDEICDENTMQRIEAILNSQNPKFALFGNKLRQSEKNSFTRKSRFKKFVATKILAFTFGGNEKRNCSK